MGQCHGETDMNTQQQLHFNALYQQHLNNLTLQGKRPATIDAYSRAIRRIATYFDCPPDHLTLQQLKTYFVALIDSHSWSTENVLPLCMKRGAYYPQMQRKNTIVFNSSPVLNSAPNVT